MTSDPQRIQLTRRLANFCADQDMHARYPASAILTAELAIADTVGCILAAVDDPAVVKLGLTIPDEPSGPSRRSNSVRHAFPVSARDAAAVNGCAAHALDFDDNVLPAVIHSSAILVPALFALADEIHAPGADIVRAFIVGMEVNAQIGRLVNPRHHESGWHTISTIGLIGAAAACAALMKLDSDQAGHAMSLAFSKAGGSKLQFGSEAKPMQCGFSAEGGVWAAQLARQGFEGNREVLQGKWSFQDLYAGCRSDDIFEPVMFPDALLAIDEYPPVAKLYPCCGSAHLGIGALLELRDKHRFALQDIERIDVHMQKVMTENVRYKVPLDEKEARFSMPYCAAVSLVHGIPRLSHFMPEAVSQPDPMVARLMPLVHTFVRDPTEGTRKLPFGGDCYVEIRLKDGEVLKQIAEYPKGCTDNPLTVEERRIKFLDCAATRLEEARAAQLYSSVGTLFRTESIADITSALRMPRS
ncbi:MmgE/PrpD family protein [Noviherbaspirillum sp.]|uniref:MmgE/PrpD family protein n=1 Tax=Noviherbaspirillum sp. TaxID=1926288 RepID=UPI002B46A853|nr:MmgE/PrpD family protein [Noviherbaspirillum sp.]HJV82026.1 MmgE/PrpD family protein [Noviherbaspirillum sp.]